MKTHDRFEEESDPVGVGSSEGPKKLSVEEQIEHWKRVGEANAIKYGIKAAPGSRVVNY